MSRFRPVSDRSSHGYYHRSVILAYRVRTTDRWYKPSDLFPPIGDPNHFGHTTKCHCSKQTHIIHWIMHSLPNYAKKLPTMHRAI